MKENTSEHLRAPEQFFLRTCAHSMQKAHDLYNGKCCVSGKYLQLQRFLYRYACQNPGMVEGGKNTLPLSA